MTKTLAVRAHVRRSPSKPAVYTDTHARLRVEVNAVRAAMEEAAKEIESWRGYFVPLEEVGITGETADRLKETW